MTDLLHKLIRWIIGDRPYDVLVDKDYLERWHIIPRNPFFNIYYHRFIGSDGPVMHDHPWCSLGIILDGWYMEETPQGTYRRIKGDVIFRRGSAMHAIADAPEPVYTLFITGPRYREWGFLCGDTWIHHQIYLKHRGKHRASNGCGEFPSITGTHQLPDDIQ